MPDGQRLLRRRWARPGSGRGVLLVHGLGEHSGRYRHTAAWFHARGHEVLAYDQRGHGQSPGPRGALRQSEDLLNDLAAVFAEFARGFAVPPLLLGHSMGGLVALRSVLDGRVAPSALVLTSPALRSRTSRARQRLAGVLARVAPGLPLRIGLDAAGLSHDPVVVAEYRDDPLTHATITPRLADFIFRAGPACIADAHALTVPTLLLVAGADTLVDPGGSRDFAAAARDVDALTTRYFATLRHELLNEAEPGRGQVLKQLADWLDQRGPGHC